MPSGIPYPEVYDEAKEVLITYEFTRELASINGIEDFSFQDLWDPQGKRLRLLLSGIINFLKYKDQQFTMLTSLKDGLHSLQSQRQEQEQKCEQLDHQLQEAHAKHNDELPLMYAAETAAHEAKVTLEKVQKDVKSAETLLETTTKRRDQWQERVTHAHQEVRRLREDVAQARSRIAESPEDMQQQIVYLNQRIPEQRERGEELHEEKRTLVKKVQTLGELKNASTEYLEILREAQADEDVCQDLAQKCTTAQRQLRVMEETRDRLRSQSAQLDQQKNNVANGIDQDKQAHAERMQLLAERRQRAVKGSEEQLEKLSKEKGRLTQQQIERSEMQAEMLDKKREFEAEMAKLQSRQQEILEEIKDFSEFAEKEMASSYIDLTRAHSLRAVEA